MATRILDRVRKGTTIADRVAIGISICALLFTVLRYTTSLDLPDVKYYYTTSRDLNFKEGFGRFPEIQNRHIMQSKYYSSIKEKEEEGELEQGIIFLWLVIRNEGEGRAKNSYLKAVTYRFRNGNEGFDDTPRTADPRESVYDKYGPLPHSIYPRSVVVLLCEHFVPSEGKNPDKFIKENMGFEGFTVKARIKRVIRIPFSSGGDFKDNYATCMWPCPD